jgi:hypothetical protein
MDGRKRGRDSDVTYRIYAASVYPRRSGAFRTLTNISTAYVERQNLTMRMSMRRFTRLTNGFSKKVENLQRSLALYFMHSSFCRKHSTIKTTPAIKAALTDRLWTLRETEGPRCKKYRYPKEIV